MYEITDSNDEKIEGKFYSQELQQTNIPDLKV